MSRFFALFIKPRPAPVLPFEQATQGDYEMSVFLRAMSPQYAGDRS